MRRASVAIALVGSLVLAGAAAAHHGFTGRYDTDRPIWLTGAVIAISAAPPHPTITIRVDPQPGQPPRDGLPGEFTGALAIRAEDRGQIRTIEFPPVGTFYDLGRTAKVGDRVQIMALRNCRPPHQLRSQWIRLPAGEIVQRMGRLSYMDRGCAES